VSRPERPRKARPGVTELHLMQSPSWFDTSIQGEGNQEIPDDTNCP
jgi:hypothetical protein